MVRCKHDKGKDRYKVEQKQELLVEQTHVQHQLSAQQECGLATNGHYLGESYKQ